MNVAHRSYIALNNNEFHTVGKGVFGVTLLLKCIEVLCLQRRASKKQAKA